MNILNSLNNMAEKTEQINKTLTTEERKRADESKRLTETVENQGEGKYIPLSNI